ncbi:MAG: GTPase HflX [SAR324 cluster bacterium]|nr:GTPase HflX [SAR324 cluster bacterium]
MQEIEQDFATGNALLLSLHLPTQTHEDVTISLDELESLARTMGFNVKGRVTQSRSHIDSATYFGKGKLEEIKLLIEQEALELIIVNAQLSPNQNRNLEKYFKCSVIDRTFIILTIFEKHAQTREAKLQIGLAHAEYLLPRLVGMWQHLDRERGGINASRGTGETQIEKDRQMLRQRIARLREELKHVEEERKTQKKRRASNCLNVSLVGYTNAGKSTIMNGLTDSHLLVEDKLFATLESTTRVLEDKSRPQILLSDTVGFIRNLPHELVASFRSTLEMVNDADLLLNVVDASGEYEDHIQTTLSVLAEIDCKSVPILTVFNKTDLISPLEQAMLQKKYPEAILVSAEHQQLDELRQKILKFFEKRMETISVCLDYQDTGNLKEIYEWSRVDKIDYKDDAIYLTLTGLPANLNRLRHHLDAHIKGT